MNELEKWDKCHEKVVDLNEFMDFLNEKKLTLCELVNNEHYYEQFIPTMAQRDKLIAEFFNIDLDKLDKERKELLESLRK